MTSRSPLIAGLALGAVGVLTLAGCSSTSSSDASTSSATPGALSVVASTNVYGDIAASIGGDAVDVTSLITSGAQDPHEYEATAQDQLAVNNAALVIENGAGYDAYMDSLVEASDKDPEVITAVEYNHAYEELEGTTDESQHEHETDEADHDHDHDHIEGFNEHVWYDPHTISHVAEAIADDLSALDPSNADTFKTNLEAFQKEISGLEDSLATLKTSYDGDRIFVTEPVPLYLAEAAGLKNVTPSEFTEAVEEGQDVPPATLAEALNALKDDVKLLIVNAQTGSGETQTVIDEAGTLDIPVIEMTETLPDGKTYAGWMQDNIDAISKALAS